MDEPIIGDDSRSVVSAVPEVNEPCPWCTHPAVVTLGEGQWELSCHACSMVVEVDGPPERGPVPHHMIQAAA